MALATGIPLGVITSSTELYIEGAPALYIQDYRGNYLKNPDSDNFYWNLTGTATYPVYAIGCYENETLGDNITVNAVRCDVVGDKDAIMKRNHMELKLTLKSFLPLTMLSVLTNGGTVTTNLSEHTEKFGYGDINNAQYWRIYLPKIYDDVANDYVSFTGHRCKIVSDGDFSFTYGNSWMKPVTIWLLADESMPAAQKFCTVIRADVSAI